MDIAPTLRFQDWRFLADYAAMQQSPTIPGAGPAAEAPADVQYIGQTAPAAPTVEVTGLPIELGGREGPEPTRFGDWEKAGRCIDF